MHLRACVHLHGCAHIHAQALANERAHELARTHAQTHTKTDTPDWYNASRSGDLFRHIQFEEEEGVGRLLKQTPDPEARFVKPFFRWVLPQLPEALTVRSQIRRVALCC